jgi:hypothetical protein
LILGLWLGFEVPDPSVGSQVVSGENLAAVGKVHLWAFLRSRMVESPVVILFEDLHWADAASLELFDDLVSQFAEDRLLTVAATRPEHSGTGIVVDVLGPAWQPISLGSLDLAVARGLVAEILKRVEHLPDSLVDLVVERADGNPFYIEELIKKLIDDGCIVTNTADDRWSADVDRLDETTIPRTLTGVLQARFDVLPEAVRRSLQRASIVGRTFESCPIASTARENHNVSPGQGPNPAVVDVLIQRRYFKPSPERLDTSGRPGTRLRFLRDLAASLRGRFIGDGLICRHTELGGCDLNLCACMTSGLATDPTVGSATSTSNRARRD